MSRPDRGARCARRATAIRAASILAALGTGLPAAAAEICLPGPGAPALVLADGTLREGPDGTPIDVLTGGRAIALACAPGRAAVAFDANPRSRIAWLERGSAGWALAGEARLRGEVTRLIVAGDRLAGVLRLRRETALFVIGAADERPTVRELSAEPACLTTIADRELVVTGIDERLHTFRRENAGTWVVWSFDAAITACDAADGGGGILVATGRDLLLVHPDDRATRGRLPVRARTALDAPVAEIAWTGGGEVAAVRTADGRVVFVSGRDLETLHTAEVPTGASRLAAVATGWVAWARPDGSLEEARVPDAVLAREPRKPPPAPPGPRPPAAVPAPGTQTTNEGPSAAVGTSEPAPGVRVEGIVVPEPEQAPAPAPESRPSPAPAPAPGPVQVPTPEQESRPSPAPAPAPGPVQAPAPEQESRPSPAPAPAPDPVQAPAPEQESRPSPAPAPAPVPDPPTEPDSDVQRNAEPEPAISPPRTGPFAIPVGGLGGTITGRADLVAEIVVLGPDNILKEFRRVRPAGAADRATFLLDALPPGTYRVLPMGEGGMTLSARPPFLTVTVSAETAARADFEIRGSLP